MKSLSQNADTYEYIIVGSGAGGGTLAARLALNGKKVLLIEAGDDRGESLAYQIPVFHAHATEDPAMSWDFYVNHYTADARAKTDSKLYDLVSGENRCMLTTSIAHGNTRMESYHTEKRIQAVPRRRVYCTPEQEL